MIAADLVRAGLVTILAVHHQSPTIVYAIAFGMSTGAAFFNPSAGAVLPTLVGKESLVAANSGIWTAAVIPQIALAPLAGLLVSAGGYTAAFSLNALSFVISAVALTRLPRLTAPPVVGQRRVLGQARGGIRVIARDRVLRALATGQLLAALSAGATSALLVVLARQHLHVSPSGYGLLLGAIGVGAACGPLLLLRLIRTPQRPLFVYGPFALRGVVDVILAVTTSLPVAVAVLALYGIGTSTGAVTFNTLLQVRAPQQARGRVFAAMDVLWQTGRLLSLAIGAALADTVGITAVYLLGGTLLLLAAVVGVASSREATPESLTL
jgi:predicted MFS family arabinose efflux permease